MEKKKIDVTIIVPVYNVEKYLEKCLDSLVKQNYDKDKYEILLINDCSLDNSLEIINKYRKEYDNITLCDLNKNKGVSNARNIGIEKALGEYLIFCDSDDYYDLDAINKMINIAKKRHSDYVMANYVIVKNNKEMKVNSTGYFSNNISREEIVSYMNLTSCSKLIKKDLFIKNKIVYPTDLKRCEELTVIPVLAYLANNPVVIDEYLYYYVQRNSSASNKKVEKKDIDLSFFDISFERFQKCVDKEKYKDELEFRAIDHLLYGKCLVMLKSKIDKRSIMDFIKSFKKAYPNYLKNKYLKKYSLLKKVFIYTLNWNIIFIARLIARIHEIITG